MRRRLILLLLFCTFTAANGWAWGGSANYSSDTQCVGSATSDQHQDQTHAANGDYDHCEHGVAHMLALTSVLEQRNAQAIPPLRFFYLASFSSTATAPPAEPPIR